MSARKKTLWLVVIILLVLILDQALKIWIKTHMTLHESISVFSWFQILFVENNGMAFGMEIIGKLFLTLFRVVASGAIIYFLVKLIKKGYSFGYITCIGLILAGAVGNLIDSTFYGLIFSHSEGGQVAALFPSDGGYSSLFYGKVVDMFYFPIITNGSETIFFNPVFNLADSSVTVGVFLVLLFFRKELNNSLESKPKGVLTEDAK